MCHGRPVCDLMVGIAVSRAGRDLDISRDEGWSPLRTTLDIIRCQPRLFAKHVVSFRDIPHLAAHDELVQIDTPQACCSHSTLLATSATDESHFFSMRGRRGGWVWLSTRGSRRIESLRRAIDERRSWSHTQSSGERLGVSPPCESL